MCLPVNYFIQNDWRN